MRFLIVLQISKDTSSCKKSNKAPWNVPGAAKIEHPGDITSIAMHDNAPKLQTESTLSPEVSDILYDTGVRSLNILETYIDSRFSLRLSRLMISLTPSMLNVRRRRRKLSLISLARPHPAGPSLR